jgi:hypothetical protein
MLYHRHLRKPLKAEGRVGAASLVTTKMLAFIASMQAVVGLGREYGLEWKVFGSPGGGRGGGRCIFICGAVVMGPESQDSLRHRPICR